MALVFLKISSFLRHLLRSWPGLLLLLDMVARAAESDRPAGVYPSFYFDSSYAFTTTKSELLDSNDTGTALRYGVGTFTGDRDLEFNIGFQSDTTTFALNDSSAKYDWQDTKVRYYLGPFYLGAVFSRLNAEITQAGTDVVSAAGSGYGGTVGMLLPIGGRGGHALLIDVTSVAISETKNELEATFALPSRLDIDVGAHVSLIGRWLDFSFGYRMRTLTHDMGGSFADQVTETYVGLKLTTTQ